MTPRHNLIAASFSSDSFSEKIIRLLRAIGYHVKVAKGDTWLREPADGSIILLDNRPNKSNQDLLAEIGARNKKIFCIYEPADEEYISPIFEYCVDFMLWPCQAQELATRLDRFALRRRRRDAPSVLNDNLTHAMIGNSKLFLMLLDKIRRIAVCDAPVMISGETGTGKELAARAIHYNSARGDKPFIPVNCGALPDSLLENELFGHEKGAYTHASSDHAGLVAQADGGTLFLDEIDALTLKAQVTLLRFLQEQEYRPLGGKALKKANIRVISASNKNLEDLAKTEVFRDDLFFRLNVIPLRMPALRERRGDVRVLSDYFISKFKNKYQLYSRYLSEEAYLNLERYDWPGNVRELEAVIHREFLMSQEDMIMITLREDNVLNAGECSVYDIDIDSDFNDAKNIVVKEFEKRYLTLLMEEHNGNVTLAARHAGKERRALGKLLKKHGIDKAYYA